MCSDRPALYTPPMFTVTRACRFSVFCLLFLTSPFQAGGQTISRLTDQVFETHRSSSPDYFINLTADKVLFMATPSGAGNRLPFVTDGTTFGTVPLLPPQPSGTVTNGGYQLLGSHAYFFTYLSGNSTSSLWKTDGTPGGTTLITDQAPAYVGSIEVVNGRLIGVADDYPNNFLWASDGTPQGTGSIYTPPANSSIYSGSVANGTYFLTLVVATDDGHRDAIWKSDGTSGGTIAVKTLSHQVEGSIAYDHTPTHPTALNGSVYFLARENVYHPTFGDYFDRSVLWRTDGTPAGTHRVGNFSALYHRMYAFAGSLFLEKSGSVDGWGSVTPPQIVRSDGTITGSSVVFVGNYPRSYTSMQRLGEYGGHVYYNAVHYNVMYPSSPRYSDLHRMSPSGEFEGLGTLPSGWNYSTGDQLSYAYALASRPSGLYLGTYGGVDSVWKITSTTPATIDRLGGGAVASNATIGGHMIGAGNNFTSGVEVYSSQSGHTLIADLSPGTESSDASYSGFQGGARASLGNLLLYNGQDPAHGTELWRSDGTADGTFRLKDISTGPTSSSISAIFPSNGFAWFIVQRGDITPAYTVAELWKTDGTAAGTTFIKRCPESETWSQFYSDDSRIVVKKSQNEGNSSSLEILDGPGAGNVSSTSSAAIGSVVTSGALIWWQENEGSGSHLKQSPSSGGLVETVNLPTGHTLATIEIAYGDGVVGTTISGNNYHVVWFRPSGSVVLQTREGYTYFSSFREHDGRVYFIDGNSLYASDGTAHSAVMIHTANQIGNSGGDGFVSHQGSLYFLSRESYDGPRKVWKTGGTAATTTVTPIQLAPGYSEGFLVSNGDWLLYPYEYFDSALGVTVQQARYSFGIADGEIISDFTSADLSFHSGQKLLKPLLSGTVFFNRYTAESGDELYKLELPAAPSTSPFGLWAQNHGLSGTSALPNEDADKDGSPNLVEFYSGTAPNLHSSSVRPVFGPMNSAGTPLQAIAISRMPGTGLSLVVESSIDLVNWNPDVTIASDGTHTYALSKRLEINSRIGSSPEIITFAIIPSAYPKIFVRFRVAE